MSISCSTIHLNKDYTCGFCKQLFVVSCVNGTHTIPSSSSGTSVGDSHSSTAEASRYYNKESVLTSLQICEQQTGDRQCILCGTSFAMDVELIAHLVVAHQHDIDLKSTQQQTVFQALPFLFTCLFKYLKNVFASDGDLPASSVPSNNTAPVSQLEVPSSEAEVSLPTRKRKANGRSGPYKECSVSASLARNDLYKGAQKPDHLSRAWQPRVKIQRCSILSNISATSTQIKVDAVEEATEAVVKDETASPIAANSSIGPKAKKAKTPRKGRKKRSQNAKRVRATRSGAPPSLPALNTSLYAEQSTYISNAAGEKLTPAGDTCESNVMPVSELTPVEAFESRLLPVSELAPADDASDSNTLAVSELESREDFTPDVTDSYNFSETSTDMTTMQQLIDAIVHNESDVAVKAENSFELTDARLDTVDSLAPVSATQANCIRPAVPVAPANAADETPLLDTASYTKETSKDDVLLPVDALASNRDNVDDVEHLSTGDVADNRRVDTKDETADVTSDVTVDHMPEHVIPDTAVADANPSTDSAIDDLFDDAISDVSSVSSAATVDYVPDHVSTDGADSDYEPVKTRRRTRGQTSAKADKAVINVPGNAPASVPDNVPSDVSDNVPGSVLSDDTESCNEPVQTRRSGGPQKSAEADKGTDRTRLL